MDVIASQRLLTTVLYTSAGTSITALNEHPYRDAASPETYTMNNTDHDTGDTFQHLVTSVVFRSSPEGGNIDISSKGGY